MDIKRSGSQPHTVRLKGKGEGEKGRKTFNPYPLTFSLNQFLVQNADPNRIGATPTTAMTHIAIQELLEGRTEDSIKENQRILQIGASIYV